ncbi:MAG: hypothetical protein V2J07_06385, partial [Anaerolineae bacterium]|nr:hypothetical protein [Anaerolineae bacterium]
MLQRYLQNMIKNLKTEKWGVHLVLLLAGGLLAFTLVNILFPLAIYTPGKSLLLSISGLVLVEILTFLTVFHWAPSLLPAIKKHWFRNALIAGGITLLIFAVLPHYSLYRPVTHHVRIETTTPGFATRWVDSDNHSTIPIADITFTGAWEKEGD